MESILFRYLVREFLFKGKFSWDDLGYEKLFNENKLTYEVNTDSDLFLSSDEGLSWKEIKKWRYIFNIGYYGSIIVISPEI